MKRNLLIGVLCIILIATNTAMCFASGDGSSLKGIETVNVRNGNDLFYDSDGNFCVTQTWSEADLLKNSYFNSLQLAEQYQCKTVAFPSISTGVYRYPLGLAAPIAVNTITEFLKTSHYVQDVIMVCFDPVTKQAYEDAMMV